MNPNGVINYSDIKGKAICLKTKYNNKYNTLVGTCICNPPMPPECAKKRNIVPCLGMSINYKIPPMDAPGKRCYVFYNLLPIGSGYSVYIAVNEIETLCVLQNDVFSKRMLCYVGKEKKLPEDIVFYISKFMKGWKVEIPVIDDYNSREII